MGKKNIPQYHTAYTEEDNKMVQEYLEHATPESLIDSIRELCQLYPEEEREKVLKAIDSFTQRVAHRNDLYQRYQKLLNCRDAWTKYRNDLETYPKIKEIRKAYDDYKTSDGERTTGIFESFMQKYWNTVCSGYSDSKVKKFLVSSKKSTGIKKALPAPDFLPYDRGSTDSSHDKGRSPEKSGKRKPAIPAPYALEICGQPGRGKSSPFHSQFLKYTVFP